MAKFNGNLKLIVTLIVIVGFIASIGAAWALTSAKADCAMDKAKAVEEKQDVVNKSYEKRFDTLDTRQMRIEDKLDRTIEHLRVPAKK